MVSINSASEILFCDVRSALLREVKALAGRSNPDEAFAAWLLREVVIELQLKEATQQAIERTMAQRDYRDVATLGYAVAAGVLELSQHNVLKAGLTWVAGREPLIDGVPADFYTDTIAILGIALGASHLGEDSTKAAISNWITRIISHGLHNRLSDWQRCLLTAAQCTVSESVTLPIPNASTVSDVRVALRAKGLFPLNPELDSQDELEALSLMKLETGVTLSPARSALRVASFDSIQATAPAVSLSRPTVEDVSRLLDRVPAALRRWTWEDRARTRRGTARKWYIDNEYHVQNLLHFLLLPIFPDLREEDYTPPVGQKRPRADLCIPRLRLAIEVKFMRLTDTPQDMIDQISSDSSLYLVEGSIYESIIAFIWDDSRRSEEHDLLRNGLKQLRGVVDAVVVSRPGSMIAEESLLKDEGEA